ncbi:L,L-diaminopimelate aminotransferase, DapL2 type [hydrothermal vent metagenome]|uniref:L,L-diaminopimelate aminotransferase, DapL2 type n=1 Tax=hydrothermal vent metagenome TaxID=652676 RepID=A0A3B1CHE4_9ZZZZ
MAKLQVELADRIKGLPPYLFAAIDLMKQEAIEAGKDIINLGVGDPDLPTPAPIIASLQKAATNPKHHQYPSYVGMLSFRQAVADWYKRRFNATLDAKTEVLSLIGSKEGVAHLPMALINPGDTALMTDPGYPVYEAGTLFAGGKSVFVPLKIENGFLPDLDAIPDEVADKAKLFFLNYPGNPTAAVATRDFFEKLVAFAHRHNIVICHDAAYSEIYYDGKPPIGFMEIDGAKDVGIELHSLSKTYNMTGWRIGFAVGNSNVVGALGQVKTNIDSGIFQAIQEAGITALEMDDAPLAAIRNTYQERRDVLVSGLQKLGFKVDPPKAAFYVWIPTPPGISSSEMTAKMLKECAIVTTPGSGFGANGEGYFRMTLCVSKERLAEAIDRMEKAGIRG